ncbi:MAG TPA: hypothetical protein VE136_08685 [Anaerolineales bacterium]|nr:hypothetical protein [Anaerolineales bacterium]
MSIDIDETKVARNEFGMWLEWTLATAIGMLLGYLPSITLVDLVDVRLGRVVIPVLAGLVVGLSQWIVLRRYLTECSDWILAGGAGWAAGYALGLFLINSLTGTLVGGFLGYVLFGVIIALFQWPVLRREIPNALTWVLASVIGWSAGLYLSQVSLNIIFSGPSIDPAASTSVIAGTSGLVAGAITGLALVLIVRQPEHRLRARH